MDEAEIRRKLCEILGVKASASADEIKKAYTTEAKKWHPDRVQHNPELAAIADKKLKQINQAYECLTDRVQYDRYAAKLANKQVEEEATAAKTAGSANTAGAPKTAGSANSTGSTSTGSAGAAGSAKATAAPGQETDKAGIVKIFLATGLFVLIVIVVANLTSPRQAEPQSPGVVLSPADSPAAPIYNPPSDQNRPNTLPPDSSVGPPPGAN